MKVGTLVGIKNDKWWELGIVKDTKITPKGRKLKILWCHGALTWIFEKELNKGE